MPTHEVVIFDFPAGTFPFGRSFAVVENKPVRPGGSRRGSFMNSFFARTGEETLARFLSTYGDEEFTPESAAACIKHMGGLPEGKPVAYRPEGVVIKNPELILELLCAAVAYTMGAGPWVTRLAEACKQVRFERMHVSSEEAKGFAWATGSGSGLQLVGHAYEPADFLGYEPGEKITLE